MELSPLYPVKVAALVVITAIVAMPGLKRHHPFARFGPANTVTALRALLVSVVAGLIGERSSNEAAWAAAGVGVLATVLDGADGWLARRTSLASDFGARFDMRTNTARKHRRLSPRLPARRRACFRSAASRSAERGTRPSV